MMISPGFPAAAAGREIRICNFIFISFPFLLAFSYLFPNLLPICPCLAKSSQEVVVVDGRDIWEGGRGVNKGKKETYLIICGKKVFNSKRKEKNYIKSEIPPYAIFHIHFFLLLILFSITSSFVFLFFLSSITLSILTLPFCAVQQGLACLRVFRRVAVGLSICLSCGYWFSRFRGGCCLLSLSSSE